ncbi:MAG: aspartate kinase [Oscillospiraceae bacterium]|nr:aspartate kinase [Oscillospiraceae bacterium]
MAKVVKFGGSSLADANQFKKTAEIIRADKQRRYVIPSAPGKRFDTDIKVTDMLYACYDAFEADRQDEGHRLLCKIEVRFHEIIEELGLGLDFGEEFIKITSDFVSKAGRDYAASRGEYLNGLILAEYLQYVFVDAVDVIRFKQDGTFDADETDKLLADIVGGYKNAVIPGFYGSKPNKEIKTFSRGGSDITGSLVAKAIKAAEYENWTDVSGFLMADPRIVNNPRSIRSITYSEMRELSYMGATVLHEDAIFPVREAKIPICIKNTNNPDDPGTTILFEADGAPTCTITGIAGKKNFDVVHIVKNGSNNEVGFLFNILMIFQVAQVNVEHIATGIDSLSLVVEHGSFTKHTWLKERIENNICNTAKMDIQSHLALIAVVGRGMIGQRGTAAKIFSALYNADVNVRIIDQGASELNIIIGVDENDFEQAVRAIYKEFTRTEL